MLCLAGGKIARRRGREGFVRCPKHAEPGADADEHGVCFVECIALNSVMPPQDLVNDIAERAGLLAVRRRGLKGVRLAEAVRLARHEQARTQRARLRLAPTAGLPRAALARRRRKPRRAATNAAAPTEGRGQDW